MIHNITENIQGLAVDIELLIPLENNSRRGDVDAIMASYSKFGQVKPIVAVMGDNDSLTVIAGNHQLEAAKRLGWQQIAVSVVDMSTSDALAFALADNRLSEMGTTDNDLLYEMLKDAIGYDEDFFDLLGWDDFSIAAIENTLISDSLDNTINSNGGWTSPEIVINDITSTAPVETPTGRDHLSVTDPTKLSPTASTESIVSQGSTVTESSGTTNAAIQFTLVFGNSLQQSKWYSFIRWLKDQPTYDGDTTSERVLSFIDKHTPQD